MRTIYRCIRKVFARLLVMAICAVLIVGVVCTVRGYEMYQSAVRETSVSERVSDIQNQENYVKYEELPQFYIDAVISVEDHRFDTHCGIDVIAIGRAALSDIKAGSFVEGGSTITQQIAKNLFFSQKKEMTRKFAEVFAALELEKEYDKSEIFEIYVNTIYFGSDYYGIYDAAMGYYGKAPSDLTDYESAMLAGLPNAPSAYSPDTNMDLAVQRVRQVLDCMVKFDAVTQEQAEAVQESAE